MFKFIQIVLATVIIEEVIQLNFKDYGSHFEFKIRHLNGILQDDNIRKWIQHTQIKVKKSGCRLFLKKASRTLSSWISEKSLYTNSTKF